VLIAIDTSVLVAAAVAVHPDHERAAESFAGARAEGNSACVSLHAMAETYSVLTKLPLVERILPPAARAYLEVLRGFVSTVAITEPMYLDALDRCATRGLGSGAVFDALHLVAAEAAGADLMLTFNERDFSRLAGAGSPRVASSV
jgi:predicted nucleic acid-binding protein